MTNKKTKKDPFAAREAKNYDNPVPSREFILEQLADLDRPVNREELSAHFKITDEDELEALRRRLRAMERDGQIIFGRRGRYGLVHEMDLICGFVEAHRDGFGFLAPEDGGQSLYLSAREMRGLFHGDKILARVINDYGNRGRREASVARVLERAVKEVAGRLSIESGLAFVAPDDRRIQDVYIPLDKLADAKDGQIVSARITSYPLKGKHAIGEVMEILGDHMAPGMEIDLAIRSHGLPHIFPDEVLSQAAIFSDEVQEADLEGRKDLRHLPFITIDGEDAKDFDDAVYCKEQTADGWCLQVAIADVGHYVKSETALDVEAQNRGNSVYFPGNVIPMLPEHLSNGLCSLNPHVDRLVLVCQMLIGSSGKIGQAVFFEAVIRSHQRLTYDQVDLMLRGKYKVIQEFKDTFPLIERLHALYKALAEKRKARGAIAFESTETKIVFGEGRKIKEIVPVVQTDAHRIIEECMLAANMSAAKFMQEYEVSAIYREHPMPSLDDVKTLRAALSKFDINIAGGDKPKPEHYAFAFNRAAKRPNKHMLMTLMLRSLNQAVYKTDNIEGHFGLAYDAYTHFTSPIRRYPDLLVHRIIRAILRDDPALLPNKKTLQHHAAHCSMTERRADDATRDAVSWLKCEFMLDKIGEQYHGAITGVTSFGFFVALQEVYVEGLVHVSTLKSAYYKFDADHYRLVGKQAGDVYQLGDKVEVEVASVNLDARKMDFTLLDIQPPKQMKRSAPEKATRAAGKGHIKKRKKSQ